VKAANRLFVLDEEATSVKLPAASWEVLMFEV
jgi:hypothetical protein